MKKIFFLVFVLGFLNVKSQCDTTLSISVTPTQSGGTATWAAVTGAVTYSWAVIPASGSTVSIISGATTSTIVSFSGLNASTSYRFQVVTVCSGSTSQPKRSPFSTTTARVVYTPMTAAGYQYKYLKIDSLLHVSAGDTTIARGDTRPGAIVYKNSDSLFYGWNGFKWNNLGSSTTSLVNQINNKVDTIFYNTDTIFWKKNSVTYGIVLNLVPNIRAIVAGYGLAGGGDLSADRSFIVDSTVIASKPYVNAALATKVNYTTGIAGRVPFFSDANTLGNDAGFFWDNTNKRLRINQSTDAGFRLDVNGTTRIQDVLTIRNPSFTSNFTIAHIANNSHLITGGNGSSTIALNDLNRIVLTSPVRTVISPELSVPLITTLTTINSIDLGGTAGSSLTISSAGSFNTTASTIQHHLRVPSTVIQGAGAAPTFNQLTLVPTINNTLSTNALVRGLFYNPTLTSLTGTTHRAIETVTGDVVIGSTSGSLLVGTTTNAGFIADINGTARFIGKITQPTTANSPKGTATLVNGVVTISNTLATTGCFIQVNYRTATAVTGTSSILTVSSLINNTSFTVTALNAGAATTNTSDNNTIEYTISN